MSHMVTISTRITNPTAVAAACRQLLLPEPVHGTAKLYSGEAAGLLVQLPGWRNPAVIETQTGAIAYCPGTLADEVPACLSRHRKVATDHRSNRTTNRPLGGKLMRIIEVLVSPTGGTTVQTRGYTGADCLQASKWLERSLGITTADHKTTEFFQTEQAQQQLPATGGSHE